VVRNYDLTSSARMIAIVGPIATQQPSLRPEILIRRRPFYGYTYGSANALCELVVCPLLVCDCGCEMLEVVS
jgi:hypothetical protein